MGADMKVDSLAPGQKNQYGMFSGWDIYHSLAQLQAMLDPRPAGDMAQSQLNYYSEDKLLQQWGYDNLNNYVMVGDPADSIITDYYTFGAHNFNTKHCARRHARAGHDGQRCATGRGTRAAVRLPARRRDVRLLQRARVHVDAARVRQRGPGAGAVRHRHGRRLRRGDADAPGEQLGEPVRPGQQPADLAARERPVRAGGDPDVHRDVPHRRRAIRRGGSRTSTHGTSPTTTRRCSRCSAARPRCGRCSSSTSRKPNGFGMYAQITNEFDFGEQFALDYAGDPAGTQSAVNNIRNTIYLRRPGRPGEQRRPRRQQLAVHLGDARHVPGELGARHAGFREPWLPAGDDPSRRRKRDQHHGARCVAQHLSTSNP